MEEPRAAVWIPPVFSQRIEMGDFKWVHRACGSAVVSETLVIWAQIVEGDGDAAKKVAGHFG